MAKKIKVMRRERRLTDDEAAKYQELREKAQRDFPPKKKTQPVASGVAAQLRRARQEQGLTWYALAQKAGIPNQRTIRDIEYGGDAKLSNVEAVAHALGLRLKLVAEERG